MVPTVEWQEDAVVMIDQRRLPAEEVYLRCTSHLEVADAIKGMAISGAPAIGVAAALGLALGVRQSRAGDEALREEMERMVRDLAATRPTAVNLFWALERMRRRFDRDAPKGRAVLRDVLLAEALAIQEE